MREKRISSMRCRILSSVTHCNTLQHTVTHCHILPHTATEKEDFNDALRDAQFCVELKPDWAKVGSSVCCSVLQRVAACRGVCSLL